MTFEIYSVIYKQKYLINDSSQYVPVHILKQSCTKRTKGTAIKGNHPYQSKSQFQSARWNVTLVNQTANSALWESAEIKSLIYTTYLNVWL